MSDLDYIDADLRVLARPVGEFSEHPRNARRGNIDAMVESLRINGQYRPAVVQRSTGFICAGNHMYRAMVQMGFSHIAVNIKDLTDEQALVILAGDNRQSELGTNDQESLGEILAELQAKDMLEGTGYESETVDEILASLEAANAPPAQRTDPDDLPTRAPARVKTGDVWQLGPHRLICADATDKDTLAALMDGRLAACIWTDPPYGVDYVGKTADALTIRNDDESGLRELLRDAFAAAETVCEPGVPFYVAAPAGPRGTDFRVALAAWRFHQALVWAKDAFVLGHSDYHYRHEDILYGHLPGEGRPGRGNHEGSRWYGDHSQDTVLQVDRPKRSAEHPTMKPFELITRCLENSTRPGALVLDPFAGSGSTLIACHQIQRVARLVEIDPHYCDVIIERYEAHTGVVPELAGEPTTFVRS